MVLKQNRSQGTQDSINSRRRLAKCVTALVLTATVVGTHAQQPVITAVSNTIQLQASDVVFAPPGQQQRSFQGLVSMIQATSSTVATLPTTTSIQGAIANAVAGLATTTSLNGVSSQIAQVSSATANLSMTVHTVQTQAVRSAVCFLLNARACVGRLS